MFFKKIYAISFGFELKDVNDYAALSLMTFVSAGSSIWLAINSMTLIVLKTIEEFLDNNFAWTLSEIV